MILIRSQGQLGNQLFLLAAVLRERRRRETVVFVGFTELSRIIRLKKFGILIPLPHSFDRRIKRLFKRLATVRPKSCQCITGESVGRPKLRRSAKCHWPLVFEFGLCQSESLAPLDPVGQLILGDETGRLRFAATRSHLESIGVDPSQFAFMHIRLGDYKDFKVFGSSPVLPVSWYLDAVRYLRELEGDIPIVVFSDQIAVARELFRGTRGLSYFAFDDVASFSAMTQARHGVLSASTFSWWAARIARIQNPDGIFIAPRYWMGFKSKQWFPHPAIEASFLDYLEVD